MRWELVRSVNRKQSCAGALVVLAISLIVSSSCSENSQAKKPFRKTDTPLSFKEDIFPIIQRNCLPCHGEDNFNPSELSLDNYESMKAGGKHGSPWVDGKSEKSIIIRKLGEKPPFGDRMPLNSRKKIAEGKTRSLTEGQIDTIAAWIDQGARNN